LSTDIVAEIVIASSTLFVIDITNSARQDAIAGERLRGLQYLSRCDR